MITDHASFQHAALDRLRVHVADLRARSPWYRELLSSTSELRTWVDFARLPFTTKQQLSENPSRFLSV
ncbi:MAG TPA: hypothetical protein PKY96_10555, partial [Flavobacteriales bacterium]|nr:hypothetical protein [Flavobacteriales bacterium]